jgi:hypothetical protein
LGDDNHSARNLAQFPNVTFLGVVEYPQLLSYLRAFDVGIMPHLSNSMTEKMNPLKLYNHFGAGIPIVSTEVANLEDLRSYVRTASNPDTFIAAIEACLAESASLGTTEREEILKRISRTCNGHRNPRHLSIACDPRVRREYEAAGALDVLAGRGYRIFPAGRCSGDTPGDRPVRPRRLIFPIRETTRKSIANVLGAEYRRQ